MKKSKELPTVNLKAAFYEVPASEIIHFLINLVPNAQKDDRLIDNEYKVRKGWEEAVQIVQDYYEMEQYRELLENEIVEKYPQNCGLGPSKVEELLDCTKTERKRWEEEGRLPVVKTFNSGTHRKPIWVPMYDRRTIKKLIENPQIIQAWRAEHEANKALNRRLAEEAVKKANEMIHVVIEILAEGYRPERLHGPVAIEDMNQLEKFWKKQSEKVPFDYEDSNYVVVMKDFVTDKIYKIRTK